MLLESTLLDLFNQKKESVFIKFKIRYLKLPKMLKLVLSKTENFQKKAVLKRLKILIPKYKIRQSQKYIRRFTGQNDDHPPSPEKEDNSIENFLIRKKLFNQCHNKKEKLKNNLISAFFKSIINNYKERLRNCLFILSDERNDTINLENYQSEEEFYENEDYEEKDYEFEEDEGEYIDQEYEEEEDKIQDIDIGMSKIEETFEESVYDSKLESPIRKNIKNPNLLMDSQAFNLKLSKIQQMGEEHKFIETDNFNFTTHETGKYKNC